MLSAIEVRTEQGLLLNLPLDDISEGFVVEDIDGLDPVPATIVSSPFGQMDGEQYQSSRREKRDIVIRLGYEPDYASTTMMELRKRLYQFFMPKSRIRLRFSQTGEPDVDIYGRVESFDSPKFVKEPSATISVVCFNPDFYNPDPIVISGFTTASTVETTHIYEGTVETGIIFRLLPDRDISDFVINHRPADDSLRQLEFASPVPLIAGDLLAISTVPGSKYVTHTRAGVDTSYLFGVSPQSNWISLFQGVNKLRVFAEGAGVPYEIEYTTKYGGL